VTAGPVVVTGAAGLLGRVLLTGLDKGLDVRGVDRRRPPGRQIAGRPVARADLVRPGAARRAIRGADVVVDLAAVASASAPWSAVRRTNLPVAWNVLDGARAAGVRRVVIASSNHVVGGYELDEPYRSVLAGAREGLDPATLPRLGADAPVRPDGPYGVGKVMAEAAARHVAERDGLSVAVLRIGTVRPSDVPESPRHLATLLTHRDLVQLVTRCIEAPDDLGFGVFYGVSANTWRIWDIEPAARRLGYAPADDAEAWAGSVLGPRR